MRALKGNRGLTLIEVMMAMLISFIVFIGLTETVLVALDANLRNALRDEAVRVAESEMNTVRSLPFANVVVPSALLPSADNVVRNFRHLAVNYEVARSVTNIDASMKQVIITVTWRRGARTDTTRFTTIVRNR